jgi:hypothetical protein
VLRGQGVRLLLLLLPQSLLLLLGVRPLPCRRCHAV